MRIVLLGAPGSGKGTQAKMMAQKYKVPQISTGDILRAAVAEKTEIGKKVSAIMEAGELVSDDIVIDAVTDRLRANESRRGFVLDGFPRNIPQCYVYGSYDGRMYPAVRRPQFMPYCADIEWVLVD